MCRLSFICNYVVSVRIGFLFLWVLGMVFVFLLWHDRTFHYIVTYPLMANFPQKTFNWKNVLTGLMPSFVVGSFSILQLKRITIKSRLSLVFTY